MNTANPDQQARHDWSLFEIQQLFDLPLNDLLFLAHSIHRQNFDPNSLQVSQSLSIKSAVCALDCQYCLGRGHNQADLDDEKLMDLVSVLEAAKKARSEGASCFCMRAGWRCPPDADIPFLLEMIQQVRNLGMETSMSLGMLTAEHAKQLGAAGLDYYSHFLEVPQGDFDQGIDSDVNQKWLDTLQNVHDAGIKISSGIRLDNSESRVGRAGLLMQLANLSPHPESVSINLPDGNMQTQLPIETNSDSIEVVRGIAVSRIMMPGSRVQLSAGWESNNEEMLALCYFCGANSVIYDTRPISNDRALFIRLGLNPVGATSSMPVIEDRDHDLGVLAELKRSAENELFFNSLQED